MKSGRGYSGYIEGLVSNVSVLNHELQDVYNSVFQESDVKFKFRVLHRVGFQPCFNPWLGFVFGLREASNSNKKELYEWFDFKKSHQDRYTVEAVKSDGFFVKLFDLLGNDVLLRNFFIKAYGDGQGLALEKHALVLMLNGVTPDKVGLNSFMDCVAGLVEPFMVEEWLQVSSSHRKAVLL